MPSSAGLPARGLRRRRPLVPRRYRTKSSQYQMPLKGIAHLAHEWQRVKLRNYNASGCQTPCRKENADHYFCTTLYGNDDCSPRANVGSLGKACAFPCEKEKSILSEDNDYYFCYTSKDNSTWVTS